MTLAPAPRAFLDFVADFELREGKPVSGKRARVFCSGLGGDVHGVLDSLVPTLAVRSGVAPDDLYAVTWAGLLRSSRGDEVRNAIPALFSFLRTKFDNDPDFRGFHSRELASGLGRLDTDENLRFWITVIRVAEIARVGGHGSGNPEVYTWLVPPDVETLKDLRTFAEFDRDREAAFANAASAARHLEELARGVAQLVKETIGTPAPTVHINEVHSRHAEVQASRHLSREQPLRASLQILLRVGSLAVLPFNLTPADTRPSSCLNSRSLPTAPP